jgi:GT2 family glycosyltransferase
MSKVAILLSTIDRYNLLDQCVGTALRTAGYPFVLFWCDNGSTDQRVLDYMWAFDPMYARINKQNEGCAQMHNQMLLRAKAIECDMYCLLDNDIEIGRNNWLKELVETYEAISDSGIIGIHSKGLGQDPAPAQVLSGCVTVHPHMDVFGTRFFDRIVLDKVGYFDELSLYALCDNIYNCRVHYNGFLNYYLDGPSGKHLCLDVGDNSEYRKMKDREMELAQMRAGNIMERCKTDIASCYVPAPVLR